jgi:hypothetical protein
MAGSAVGPELAIRAGQAKAAMGAWSFIPKADRAWMNKARGEERLPGAAVTQFHFEFPDAEQFLYVARHQHPPPGTARLGYETIKPLASKLSPRPWEHVRAISTRHLAAFTGGCNRIRFFPAGRILFLSLFSSFL